MIALVLALALAAAPEAPPSPLSAKASFEAGRLAYDLGRFDEALVHFERAYTAEPLPGFLFNFGQCHFHAGRYERAVFFYELYLERAPDAANRDVVVELIADARARAAAAANAGPRGGADGGARAAERAAEQREETEEEEEGAAEADAADGAAPDPRWTYLGIGTGAAAVVVGAAAFGLWWAAAQPPATTLGGLDRR